MPHIRSILLPTHSIRASLTIYLLRGLLMLGVLAILLSTCLLPAALVLQAGLSTSLALSVGLLVFPGFPLSWHIIAETRGRRRPVRSLRMGDRLVLRTGACCIAVLLTIIVGWGGDSWVALQHARVRVGLGHTLVPLASEPAFAGFPVSIVSLVPADSTMLLAVQSSSYLADWFSARTRDQRIVEEECDIDITNQPLLVAANLEQEKFLFAASIPGLSLESIKCATGAVFPELDVGKIDATLYDENSMTDIWGGIKMAASPANFRFYILDAGGIAMVSESWTEEFEERLAGGGKGLDPAPFADALQTANEQDYNFWFTRPQLGDKDNKIGSLFIGGSPMYDGEDSLEIHGRYVHPKVSLIPDELKTSSMADLEARFLETAKSQTKSQESHRPPGFSLDNFLETVDIDFAFCEENSQFNAAIWSISGEQLLIEFEVVFRKDTALFHVYIYYDEIFVHTLAYEKLTNDLILEYLNRHQRFTQLATTFEESLVHH